MPAVFQSARGEFFAMLSTNGLNNLNEKQDPCQRASGFNRRLPGRSAAVHGHRHCLGSTAGNALLTRSLLRAIRS